MRPPSFVSVAAVLGGAVLVGVLVPPLGATGSAERREAVSARPAAATSAEQPLAGVRIALDPGHQLGNHNFPRQISRKVPAGGFTKPCNTTGTATNSGYPEATATFRVTQQVASRLRALGATVVLTRTRNSQSLWGPCVDVRGRFGAKAGAALMVSLHADGAAAGGHGFHVIAPKSRSPWTTDIAEPSLRLAKALRAGLDGRGISRATYLAGGRGLTVRGDLATLNLADVPTAMVELGNMRNRGDARRLSTSSGQAAYAAAVVQGIRTYLHR